MKAVVSGPVQWAGPTLIAIGVLHTIVMGVLFFGVYWDIVAAGMLNTVSETANPLWGAAFWALLFGFLLMIIGGLLPGNRKPVPLAIRFGLFAVILLGIVIMPTGGFWLGLPVALALMLRG